MKKRITSGDDDGAGVGISRNENQQIIIGGANFKGGDVNKYVAKVCSVLGRTQEEEPSYIDIMVACKLKIALCKAELDMLQSYGA